MSVRFEPVPETGIVSGWGFIAFAVFLFLTAYSYARCFPGKFRLAHVFSLTGVILLIGVAVLINPVPESGFSAFLFTIVAPLAAIEILFCKEKPLARRLLTLAVAIVLCIGVDRLGRAVTNRHEHFVEISDTAITDDRQTEIPRQFAVLTHTEYIRSNGERPRPWDVESVVGSSRTPSPKIRLGALQYRDMSSGQLVSRDELESRIADWAHTKLNRRLVDISRGKDIHLK